MAFARRQKARKITTHSSDDESDTSTPHPLPPPPPPPAGTRGSARPKLKKKSLRLSFTGEGEAADSESSEPVFVPKKSALSRKAIERNAARKAGLAAGVVGMERLSLTPGQERVSYSAADLAELKKSQIASPSALVDVEDEGEGEGEGEGGDRMNLDAQEEAGDVAMTTAVVAASRGTEILDEGLVRVMKARRKERAQAAKVGAKDFISLDASDNDDENEIMLRPKKKKESRLARPDEFDDSEEIANYVDDDEQMLLTNNKAARKARESRRKKAIRETIAEAEGGADDEADDTDVSRDSLVDAWERDQIRRGAFSDKGHVKRGLEGELEDMARNPPVVQPLPKMKDVVTRLEVALREMELRKKQAEKQIEMLLQEKSEIREREETVQERLKGAGEQYERLRRETKLGGAGPEGVVNRGLESFGSTPVTPTTVE